LNGNKIPFGVSWWFIAEISSENKFFVSSLEIHYYGLSHVLLSSRNTIFSSKESALYQCTNATGKDTISAVKDYCINATG